MGRTSYKAIVEEILKAEPFACVSEIAEQGDMTPATARKWLEIVRQDQAYGVLEPMGVDERSGRSLYLKPLCSCVRRIGAYCVTYPCESRYQYIVDGRWYCAGCGVLRGWDLSYVEGLERRPSIARGFRSTPTSRARTVAKYGVRQ